MTVSRHRWPELVVRDFRAICEHKPAVSVPTFVCYAVSEKGRKMIAPCLCVGGVFVVVVGVFLLWWWWCFCCGGGGVFVVVVGVFLLWWFIIIMIIYLMKKKSNLFYCKSMTHSLSLIITQFHQI